MSRARKSGDAARLENKLEEKYDELDKMGTPRAVVDWFHEVLEGKIQQIGSESGSASAQVGYTWQDVQVYLKDGVVLCMFINKLLAADGKSPVDCRPKAKSAFIAMGNIQAFNDGARAYGVPDIELFQTADLYEGRKAQMVNIISCLNKLGFVANKKNFQPSYIPPAAPKADWARDDD